MPGIPCWIERGERRQNCGSGAAYISLFLLKIDGCFVSIFVIG